MSKRTTKTTGAILDYIETTVKKLVIKVYKKIRN